MSLNKLISLIYTARPILPTGELLKTSYQVGLADELYKGSQARSRPVLLATTKHSVEHNSTSAV